MLRYKNANAHPLRRAKQSAVWMCYVGTRVIRRSGELIAYLHARAVSVTGYQNTSLLPLCPSRSPFTPTCNSRNSPSWFCQAAAAGVQAGSSTAQIVCLFAHDSACILFIREKCMPPMAQKQLTGWKEREMQMCVCNIKHV